MCKFQHSHCLLFRPASFLIFIEKKFFLFQNYYLGSLHVSLGSSHMLAKGTNFQDRQLIRKKCLSCPICQFILKFVGFLKKNLEILMVNHYLNIVYSFLYCFEPFCCCTVLSSTSHAMELFSLMQDHCRPQTLRWIGPVAAHLNSREYFFTPFS